MHRNKSVDVHQFAMVPRSEVPRSRFRRQSTHKTTFDAGYLVPVFLDEVLPGDSFVLRPTMFARMTTPIFPIMDNMYLESFFFFVPNRLLWDNWKRFMGEQASPGDSTSFVVPYCDCPAGGYAIGSLQDYMGLPTVGQVAAGSSTRHNTLYLRAYNLIYQEWFRDENLQNAVPIDKGDGPDSPSNYVLLRRGKRHDYFTSCLPWTQKGTAVGLPLGTSAPITGTGNFAIAGVDGQIRNAISGGGAARQLSGQMSTGAVLSNYTGATENLYSWVPGQNVPISSVASGLTADLSTATAATINQIRQAFQIQRLLERDARGGTRYTELVLAHFGVKSPDARLQRPEYLGGGVVPINVNPIAQTSATGLTGGSSPVGTLSGFATALQTGGGFSASFTEHGVIVGLVSVRADLTYQQGLHRSWSRSTKYDFYFPAFANLGEQAVLNQEIYCDGTSGDLDVWGYQERWAELRYKPSMITGLFRSTAAGTLDGWHLAQRFTTRPTLNSTFIQETPPLSRVLAVGTGANGAQFYFDGFFDNVCVRPLPLYSVPGLVDHF